MMRFHILRAYAASIAAADVAVAVAGAILIADDHGDAIWRVFRAR